MPLWRAADSLLDELPNDVADPPHGQVRVVIMNAAEPSQHAAFTALQRRLGHLRPGARPR